MVDGWLLGVCGEKRRGSEAAVLSGVGLAREVLRSAQCSHSKRNKVFLLVFSKKKNVDLFEVSHFYVQGRDFPLFSLAHFVTARGKAGNRCKLANRSAPSSLKLQAISRSLITEPPRGPHRTRAEVFLMTLHQGIGWTTSRLIRLNTRDTAAIMIIANSRYIYKLSLHLLPII